MKVTGVRISPLQARDHEGCVLELHTDGELIGIAFGAATIQHTASRVVDELLVNKDPTLAPSLWEDLTKANRRVDGSISSTIAALDFALWDLKAKANGEPLWRTLGGLRPRANTHVRVPQSATDGAQLKSWCGSVGSTVRGIVVSATGSTSHDSQQFALARTVLGDDYPLMLDAREQWLPKEAIRYINSLEQSIDLSWIESPTASADFLGHKRIADSIRGAVCAGGRFHSATEFLPHLHHRSINIVQLDPSRLGLTATLRIADAAYGFELPIVLSASVGNTNAHIAAALPNCASVEVGDSLDGVRSDITLTDGRLISGDRAGNGLSLSPAASARVLAQQHESCS